MLSPLSGARIGVLLAAYDWSQTRATHTLREAAERMETVARIYRV